MSKVIFSPSKALPEGSFLSVCFERGEHSVTTREYPVQVLLDGTFGAVFEEKLLLECTMYKDGSGKYQEKKGRLVLRQVVIDQGNNKASGIIGSTPLDLDVIVCQTETKEYSFTLSDCSIKNCHIIAVVATSGNEVGIVSSYETENSIIYFVCIVDSRRAPRLTVERKH